ncbi:hypothetical protein ABW19_dt0201564 [Dactylella cylindrospora]|nr:hypothetical protein ABW19_dt0201564 [Dactylella cylindrospora]
MLMNKFENWSQKLDDQFLAGKPVEMEYAFKSLAMDMVTTFCFGEEFGAVNHPKFKSIPVLVFRSYLMTLHAIKAFPFIKLFEKLPSFIAKRISTAIEMGQHLEKNQHLFEKLE